MSRPESPTPREGGPAPLVTCERREAVAVVRLNDPTRRNALTLAMCDLVADLFDSLEADPSVGAVVVTGADPAFCAGADLAHLAGTQQPERAGEGLRRIYEGFLRVARSPLPTIAAVNGPAVGAGMNLALACDLRLAGPTATFDTRFLALGIHPGGGHTWLLQRAVGHAAARALVLFGQRVDAERAREIGLVWEVAEDVVDRSVQLAGTAASVPAELRTRVKVTMDEIVGVPDHPAAVDRELVDQVWSVTRPEFAERLAALQSRITSTRPAPSP